MRLQIAKPTEHTAVVGWPLEHALEDWTIVGLQRVMGLHRHQVRMVETDDVAYVVKELPDDLAEREWRLLRALSDAGLPTAEVVGVVTGRADGADGLLITRHLDYSLPYRVLLSGRGLRIPSLGDRVLDALAGLLVRVHLAVVVVVVMIVIRHRGRPLLRRPPHRHWAAPVSRDWPHRAWVRPCRRRVRQARRGNRKHGS